MKHTPLLLLLSFLVFLSVTSSAQIMGRKSIFDYTELWIKGGLNMEQLSGTAINAKYNAGATGGLFIRKYWKKFGARAELLFSSANYVTKYPVTYNMPHTANTDTTHKGDFSAVYFNLPLLFEYRLFSRVYLVAGAEYTYLLSLDDNNRVYSHTFGNHDILQKQAFSVIGGVELKLYKGFNAGIRYVKGVSNVNNGKFSYDTDSWATNCLQVTLSKRILKY